MTRESTDHLLSPEDDEREERSSKPADVEDKAWPPRGMETK